MSLTTVLMACLFLCSVLMIWAGALLTQAKNALDEAKALNRSMANDLRRQAEREAEIVKHCRGVEKLMARHAKQAEILGETATNVSLSIDAASAPPESLVPRERLRIWQALLKGAINRAAALPDH